MKSLAHLLLLLRVGHEVNISYFIKMTFSYSILLKYQIFIKSQTSILGAQLMQSQMQLKKVVKGAQVPNTSISGASNTGSITGSVLSLAVNNKTKLGLPVLAPVIDLKSKATSITDPFVANRRGSKRDKTVRICILLSFFKNIKYILCGEILYSNQNDYILESKGVGFHRRFAATK